MKKKYILTIVFSIFSMLTFAQGPWTFENSNGVWESSGTNADLYTSNQFSELDIDGAGNPQLRTTTAAIDASTYTHLKIQIKNNTSNVKMRVFYNNGTGWGTGETGDGNRYSDLLISANDSEIKTYIVQMNSNANWTGTINNVTIQFRSDDDNNIAVDDGLGTINLYDITPMKNRWDFWERWDIDWARNNSTSWGYSEGSNNEGIGTLVLSSAQWNGIRITSGINGADNPYLVIRLKNNSDKNKIRVKFDKATVSGYGYYNQTISTNDSEFKTYRLNLGSYGQWSPDYSHTDVTIQFGSSTSESGNSIEIDRIEFCSGTNPLENSKYTFNGNADALSLFASNGSSISDGTGTGSAGSPGYLTWNMDGSNDNAKLESRYGDTAFNYTQNANTNMAVYVELINTTANNQLIFVAKDGTAQDFYFGDSNMSTNSAEDPAAGTYETIKFNMVSTTKDNWTGAANEQWFFRARNSNNTNSVEAGDIYIKSITFKDNTTPIESISAGSWSNASTWYNDEIPDFRQTVNINHNIGIYGTYLNMNAINIASGKSLKTTSTMNSDVAVTYTRSIPTTNWYCITSPVEGQDIDTFATASGLASGTGNNRGLGTFDEANNEWTYYQSGASGTGDFVSGLGKAIKLTAAGDIQFTGTMVTEDASIPLTASGSGYNLVGNPYTSNITANDDADASNNILKENFVDNSNISEQTLWCWNQSTDQYDPINQASGSTHISPAQGFFVKASSAGNLSITEDMQKLNADAFQRLNPRPEIQLSLSDDENLRISKIYYIEGTTTGWDDGYDSTIFDGNENLIQIYTESPTNNQGKKLGIQSLPPDNYDNMIIPVGVNASAGTEITIAAEFENLPAGINVYLEDALDNRFTLLDENNDFSEILNSDENGTGRFYLHTMSNSLGENEFNHSDLIIYASSRNNLRIFGLENLNTNVEMFDMMGKRVLKTSFIGAGVNNINLPNLNKGVYIVKVVSEIGITNKKLIIQ